MARIRTIKPDFFRHYGLWQAEKETGFPLRVAFAGLWTVADREGRFTWEPHRIKLDCLPYDDVDFSRVLDALASRGFVVRYAVAGRDYGLLPTFKAHQVVNNKERPSALPEPIESIEELTRAQRVNNAYPESLFLSQVEQEQEQEQEGNISPLPPLRNRPTEPDVTAPPPVVDRDSEKAVFMAAGEQEGALVGKGTKSERRLPAARKKAPSEDPGFLEFWEAYPRKVGKPKAAQAYAAALKRASAGKILMGARRYAAEREGQDATYTAHPTTWLARDGWADQPPPRKRTEADEMFEKYNQLLRESSNERYEQRPEEDHPGPCFDGDWT